MSLGPPVRYWVSHAWAAARGRRSPFALCYHGVGPVPPEGDPHGLMMPSELFELHLDTTLARGYRLVGVSELWRGVSAGDGAGLGAVTVDDGLAETMATVLELATARQATVTAYIPSGLLGQPHPHLSGGMRIVDRAQLRELADAGVEIGAHGVDHSDLRLLPRADALDQLRRSRATLEDIVERPVRSMAYPFGSYDAATLSAAQEAGYETAAGCSGAGPWQPLALPREPVFASTTAARIRLKTAGLYGPGTALAHMRNRIRSPQRGRVTPPEERRSTQREAP